MHKYTLISFFTLVSLFCFYESCFDRNSATIFIVAGLPLKATSCIGWRDSNALTEHSDSGNTAIWIDCDSDHVDDAFIWNLLFEHMRRIWPESCAFQYPEPFLWFLVFR